VNQKIKEEIYECSLLLKKSAQQLLGIRGNQESVFLKKIWGHETTQERARVIGLAEIWELYECQCDVDRLTFMLYIKACLRRSMHRHTEVGVAVTQ
jgi:hypothetical protein